MLLPEVDWETCQACEPCQARLVCNTRAIMQIDPGEPPYIEYSRCSRCAACVTACCCAAITVRDRDHLPFR